MVLRQRKKMILTIPQRNAIHESLRDLAGEGDLLAMMTWALRGAQPEQPPLLSEGASFRRLLAEVLGIFTCALTPDELASTAFAGRIKSMERQLEVPSTR